MVGKIILGVVLGVVVISSTMMVFSNKKMPSTIKMNNGKFPALKDSPNGVSSQVKGEKAVDAIKVYGEPKEDLKTLIKACESVGSVEVVEATETFAHLIFTTGKIKFNDDVLISYNAEENAFDYWSQSRVGYSDMGLNRERYTKIVNAYEQLIKEEK